MIQVKKRPLSTLDQYRLIAIDRILNCHRDFANLAAQSVGDG